MSQPRAAQFTGEARLREGTWFSQGRSANCRTPQPTSVCPPRAEIRLFLPRAIDPSKSLPIPASPPFSSPLGNHPSPPGETAVEVFPGHSDAAGQRDIGHLMLGSALEIPGWFPEGLAAPSTLQGGIHVPEWSTAWCGPRGRGELRTQSMRPVLCKGHPQPCRPIPHGGLSSSGCSRLRVGKGVSGNQPVGLSGRG